MGEVLVQRDDTGRLTGFAGRDLGSDASLVAEVVRLFEAAASVLADYLHVSAECSLTEDPVLTVDRGDSHLDRELDAILETLLIAFRLLERDRAGEIAVHEGSIGVEVR